MISKLLCRPVPYPDENISNYLLRLIESSFCTKRQLFDRIKINIFKSYSSIAYYIKPSSIKLLSQLTCLNENVIERMTIYGYTLWKDVQYEQVSKRSNDSFRYCPI